MPQSLGWLRCWWQALSLRQAVNISKFKTSLALFWFWCLSFYRWESWCWAWHRPQNRRHVVRFSDFRCQRISRIPSAADAAAALRNDPFCYFKDFSPPSLYEDGCLWKLVCRGLAESIKLSVAGILYLSSWHFAYLSCWYFVFCPAAPRLEGWVMSPVPDLQSWCASDGERWHT